MSKNDTVLGWDVGGAHLKAALVDAKGNALEVIQLPCPLWRGLDQLNSAIDFALAKIDHTPCQHVVTMTGELADIFADRSTGVMQIADAMTHQLKQQPIFYAGSVGLIGMQQVSQHTAEIASANWLASAAFVAEHVSNGLFIDIGSTTSDLLLIVDGQPQNRGFTDGERMQYEELVYTGVLRTSLMSLADRVPFAGEWQTLAAEYFATTADVYRLTGELQASEDMTETADGAGKTPHDSARRIARMIGRDLSDAAMPAWVELAQSFKQIQLQKLKNAAMRSFSRSFLTPEVPIIGAGAGSFLVHELARQLNRQYLDVHTLIKAHSGELKNSAAICLPAYAVACMAAKTKL